MKEPITAPEHYKLLAQELRPLVKVIQDAFVHRPLPSGYCNVDTREIYRYWLDPLKESAEELKHTLVEITSRILSESCTGHEEIVKSVSVLNGVVKKLINIFHDIWRESFPNDLAQGQPILSAIPERVLRECLSAFEKVIDIVDKPEEMVERHGGHSFSIRVDLAAGETNRFTEWLNSKR